MAQDIASTATPSAGERATVQKVEVQVCKVDKKLGLVFGYALVCKVKDESGAFQDYYDQGSVDADGSLVADHIPESEMLAAVTDFMKSARVAKEMHSDGNEVRGSVVHSFPLTEDIAKSLGIEARMTGWLVAMQPDADMLRKFETGELTGFSIGGSGVRKTA